MTSIRSEKKTVLAEYVDINGGKYTIRVYSRDPTSNQPKSIAVSIPYESGRNINRGEGVALMYLDAKTEDFFQKEVKRIGGSYNGGLSGSGKWIFSARSLEEVKNMLQKVASMGKSKILTEYKDIKNRIYRIYEYHWDISTKQPTGIALAFPHNPHIEVYELDENGGDRITDSLKELEILPRKKFLDAVNDLGGNFDKFSNSPRVWAFPYTSLDKLKLLLQEMINLVERPPSLFDSNFFRFLNRIENIIRTPRGPETFSREIDQSSSIRKVILATGNQIQLAEEASKYVTKPDFKIHLIFTVDDLRIEKCVSYMSYQIPTS